MTRKISSDRTIITRKQAIEYFGFQPDLVAVPEQVHSNVVRWINRGGHYPRTDGLITSEPGLILSLQTADCVPVFIRTSGSSIRGLIHAGWRGTAFGIIENMIVQLQKHNVGLKDIHVFLGPSVQANNYQVDEDVAKYFQAEFRIQDHSKWHVDIPGQITADFIRFGISENHIVSSGICTFDNGDCHSFRRDGEDAGRMYSFIGERV